MQESLPRIHPPATLKTPRLVLRPWRDEDYAPFAALSADPEVMRFLTPVPDRTASDALARRFRTILEEQGWGFWAVERKDDGRFIGAIGLLPMRKELPIPPGVEIGWRLARDCWGMGLAYEAASASLEFGFTTLGLPEIVAYTTLGNLRSQALMGRLGMSRTDIVFDHPMVGPEYLELRAHCLYKITHEEWLHKVAVPDLK